MNEADIQDALEYLKHCKDVGNIIFEITQDEAIINALIEALEKQIAKKPVEMKTKWLPVYKCECGYITDWRDKEQFNYCPHCGQNLDWRFKNERN